MDLSKLSPEALSHIPAGIPPPGTTPNFENPQTNSRVIVTLSVICLSFMVLISAIRVYSRLWITRSFGWDDASCVLATISTAVYTAVVLSCLNVIGRHAWDSPISAYTTRYLQRDVIGLELTYGPTVIFVKLTFFLFYLRVFSPNQSTRWLTYFGITAIVLLYTATTITFGVLCIPSPHQSWQEAVFSNCKRTTVMSYIQGPFNVVSDFYIMLLPLPVVWKLQLPTRKKIGVSAIFLTGFLACVSSVVGLYYRVQTSQKDDVAWYLGLACLTAIIELNVGIICSCMPHMVYFFRHHNKNLSYIAPLKVLRSKMWRRRTSKPDKINLVDPAPKNPKLNTDILGTMQGEGRFMKTGDFAQTTVTGRTQDSASEEGLWTRRGGLEQ